MLLLVILHCSKQPWWKPWPQSRVIDPVLISAKQMVHCGKFEFWQVFFFCFTGVESGFVATRLPLLRVMVTSDFISASSSDLPVSFLLLRYVCMCTVKIWDVRLRLCFKLIEPQSFHLKHTLTLH